MSEELKLIDARLDAARRKVEQATKFSKEFGQPRMTDSQEVKDMRATARDWLVAATAEFENYMTDRARLVDASARIDADRAEETRQFWFRRFYTSLALANGAAFAAVGSKALDPALPSDTKVLAAFAMQGFAAGLGLAGIIPALLAVDQRKLAWFIATVSTVAFSGGMYSTLTAFLANAGYVWPWVLS